MNIMAYVPVLTENVTVTFNLYNKW